MWWQFTLGLAKQEKNLHISRLTSGMEKHLYKINLIQYLPNKMVAPNKIVQKLFP